MNFFIKIASNSIYISHLIVFIFIQLLDLFADSSIIPGSQYSNYCRKT